MTVNTCFDVNNNCDIAPTLNGTHTSEYIYVVFNILKVGG